jgi:hypothetical protein
MTCSRAMTTARTDQMSESTRDTFLRNVDARHAPIIVELDRAILAAHPDFDVGIYYRQLTYALGGDFRRWVVAIGGTKKGAALRFLYGRLLTDPHGRFRGAADSPLRTIDIASVEDVDPQLVGDYVREAVSKFEEFKALPAGWYK